MPTIRKEFKLDEDLNIAVNTLIRETGLNFTDIATVGIIEVLSNIESDLIWNNVNLRDYAKLKKQRFARKLDSFMRSELKSRHLFMNRVRKDVFIYVQLSEPKHKIIELLEQYRKEARHYIDNEELIKEIDSFIEKAKKSDNMLMKTVKRDLLEMVKK